MFDDIRVRIPLNHGPIAEQELLSDGKKKSPRRMKKYGFWNNSIRYRLVRNGQYLVIEGSFNGFLQGHNVVGSMDLMQLVSTVVMRVLDHLSIVPSEAERRAIEEGRVRLERLDIVGFLKISHLGSSSTILKCMDVGLAGSRRNRMVFPGETLVYHSHSKYWSLMAYDKARQLQEKHPETWQRLDPQVQEVAVNYLRFELRQFRRELVRLGWNEVRDVTWKDARKQFSKRMHQMLDDLREPFPTLPLPPNTGAPSINYLKALLLTEGHDFISGLPERSQRRVRAMLEKEYGVTERHTRNLPGRHRRTLERLKQEPAFPIRHAAPRRLRDAGLVAFSKATVPPW